VREEESEGSPSVWE